jgi:acetate kinase
MSDELVLTLNAGSSSVKIALYAIAALGLRRLAKGTVDFRRQPPNLRLTEGSATLNVDLAAAENDLPGMMEEILRRLAQQFDLGRIVAVGHRMVHGGDVFSAPVGIDEATLEAMEAMTRLAPLHQPQGLRLVRAVRLVEPDLMQSASFDTAFHRTNAELVQRFALPRALHQEGIKRYGFHGLSYQYIAGELARRRPEIAKGKLIVAHLGSGASLCALEGGVSRDTSMGFSTLDGIPMATRCGALDPGVLLHLLGPGGRALHEIEDILYHRSGLLGVSDFSADCRELLASDRPEAMQAIDLFTFRIAGEIARLASTLGGIDSIVFTAGIGENQPPIRASIADRLRWLGLEIDPAANTANAEVISTTASRIAAFVISTDEEQIIGSDALSIYRGKRNRVKHR